MKSGFRISFPNKMMEKSAVVGYHSFSIHGIHGIAFAWESSAQEQNFSPVGAIWAQGWQICGLKPHRHLAIFLRRFAGNSSRWKN
jgi:hypothetical protein